MITMTREEVSAYKPCASALQEVDSLLQGNGKWLEGLPVSVSDLKAAKVPIRYTIWIAGRKRPDLIAAFAYGCAAAHYAAANAAYAAYAANAADANDAAHAAYAANAAARYAAAYAANAARYAAAHAAANDAADAAAAAAAADAADAAAYAAEYKRQYDHLITLFS